MNLKRGQLVAYSPDLDHVLFAKVDEVWTNALNLSQDGHPAVSFIIDGIRTRPIPHKSAAVDGVPPYWATGDEAAGRVPVAPPPAAKAAKKTARKATSIH